MARRSEQIITGIPEIDKSLRGLVPRLQKKAARQAMRQGLKPVQKEAKALAPVDTGLMRSKVRIRALKRSKKRFGAKVQIGPDDRLVKESKDGKRSFYPAVIEFGSAHRPARPFMRRAYAMKGEEAKNLTMVALLLAIDKIVNFAGGDR